MAKIKRFPWYEFHESGYVVSNKRKQPIIMKPIRCGSYVGLALSRDDGHVEKAYLHRLICEAFHGPCPEGMECRHIDGDRTNNAASNLAWGTKFQNEDDRKRHGTTAKGENNPMAKLTRHKVAQMRKHRTDTGDSYRLIGLKFDVSTMTAFRAVTGQSWR